MQALNTETRSVATDRRPLVLGMGITGLSVARWCARRGIAATFADSRDAAPAASAIRALLPQAAMHAGGWPASLPAGTTEIVVSPGVSLATPILQQAIATRLPVYSDIDLFIAECPVPVVGVTGSNGKSTVTSLTACMLSAAGLRARAGGNLGTAALDLLDTDAEAIVLELSSFQLERSGTLPLHAAVILNLTPDHLDQHGDMATYAAAKQRIYRACQTAIINRDEPDWMPELDAAVKRIGFTLSKPSPEDWGVIVTDDGQWIARGSYPVMPVASLAIAGRHNLQNVLAAFALASTLDVPLDGLIAGAQVFPGLPHRMQRVPSGDGIVWVNDSKATNEAAAMASISAIDGRLVLIAGGDAKNAELKDLARCLEDK
ncbi:MAG: UDP-N-acetylmuramoyl-L-alanine--D-glutamate ligase, partial [Gammaproteobacteria bacterium]|nr:UDP-N-acetylmuramoyl-L-alanine--D-glutamate ligase [Gammaproteobacteria bacterium]